MPGCIALALLLLRELADFGSVCKSAVASTVCNAQSSGPKPPL